MNSDKIRQVLEENALKDYEEARRNIECAENAEGRSKDAGTLIYKANKKLDEFELASLKCKNGEDNTDNINKASMSAWKAKLLSITAIEKAKSVDLRLGWNVEMLCIYLVLILSSIYILWHHICSLPWFCGYLWWEIVFFSLFGVLTNLTYSASKHILRQDFDKWHTSWYFSKIFQAPFITIAFILMLRNVNMDVTGVSIDLSEKPNEVYVFWAYISGLFSRRVWEKLEEIKDKVLPVPESNNKKSAQSKDGVMEKVEEIKDKVLPAPEPNNKEGTQSKAGVKSKVGAKSKDGVGSAGGAQSNEKKPSKSR